VAALAGAALAGAIVELVVIRRLYDKRDHLDQVLATFALILIFSEGTRWVFGSFPLSGRAACAVRPVTLPGGIEYPLYRLALIVVGLAVAVGLLAADRPHAARHPDPGRRGDREMIAALGVDIAKLYTVVFALGAALAGLAGALVGAIQSVQVGMGEPVLILAFVVIVIGGIGSIKGASSARFWSAHRYARPASCCRSAFHTVHDPSDATAIGSSLASMRSTS
jgi:branched-chain amino acid transport system permease protein